MKRKETKGKGNSTVIKEKKKNSKCKFQIIIERMSNLDIHKNRYYDQPKAPAERIQSTFSNAVMRKRKKKFLFSSVYL